MILSKVRPSYTLWLTLFNHLCACILILNASIYFDTSFKPPALSLSILEERENIKLGAVKLTFCARGVISCVKALSCYKRTYCRTHYSWYFEPERLGLCTFDDTSDSSITLNFSRMHEKCSSNQFAGNLRAGFFPFLTFHLPELFRMPMNLRSWKHTDRLTTIMLRQRYCPLIRMMHWSFFAQMFSNI